MDSARCAIVSVVIGVWTTSPTIARPVTAANLNRMPPFVFLIRVFQQHRYGRLTRAVFAVNAQRLKRCTVVQFPMDQLNAQQKDFFHRSK